MFWVLSQRQNVIPAWVDGTIFAWAYFLSTILFAILAARSSSKWWLLSLTSPIFVSLYILTLGH
jgi:hypothetical protein